MNFSCIVIKITIFPCQTVDIFTITWYLMKYCDFKGGDYMITKIKVCVSDDEQDFLDEVSKLFPKYGLSCNFVKKDGLKIIEDIEDSKPDFAVMNLFMPKLDAIGVMNKIHKKRDIQTKFIILSNFINKTIEKEIISSGAAFIMVKPFEISELADRILQMSRLADQNLNMPEAKDNTELKVTKILHQIGIPAHIKGYHYLRNSIVESVNNPEVIDCVTKSLYPMVAKKYKTTSSRVERAIRHAIEIAWDRGNFDVLNNYFGYTIHNLKGKPTNSEFIAMISDRLRLQFSETIGA